MAIKIPVSASIDPSQVGAELNKLGQEIAKANKVKYEPVSSQTVKNLDEVERRFRSLLQINREMQRRLSVSGQQDKGFFDVDWSKAYENNVTRARKMAQAFEYVTGNGFAPGRGGRSGGAGGAISSAVAGAAQAGLRASNGATAGVGGVVANSLGTGMQAGIGAGLAGLLGGILALGVGKIVSAATEKLDEAEGNAWANDRLKRIMGDVQVSFKALEGSLETASKNINVTYAEGIKLGTQFAKLGNITEAQYKTLGTEIDIAGGMSKSFGLDPSQGVGFMGQMRGLRLTQDEQGSRKLALIIGETIAKSGAFAKADEVMDAIAGYATTQSRQSLSANTTGYAAALAGLTGSGLVGLDVGGSASILNRANAALMSGGAAGESSQFFTAMLGARHGLDPFQMQAWREGGAFATLDGTFGPNGSMGQFGMSGPGGDKTLLQANIEMLREKYGHRSPGELAHAAGRHLGMSMTNAAALMKFSPAELGGIQKRLSAAGFDLTKLNAESIATLGRLETGGQSEMANVAGTLLGRTDLSASDRDGLQRQQSTGHFDKEFLMKLVASRGQEVTDGKNIHDSKIALENIKTDMAQKLIPLTQSIRDGIMYMAGGGKKSQYEMQQEILKLESDSKNQRINRAAEAALKSINSDFDQKEFDILSDPNATGAVTRQDWWKEYHEKRKNGTLTKDDKAQFRHELETARRLHGTRFFSDDTGDRLEAAKRERDERIRLNEESRSSQIQKERENFDLQRSDLERADREALNMSRDSQLRRDVADAEREIGAPPGLLWAQMEQESRFNPNAKSKAGAMGLAQVMPDTLATLSKRAGRKLDPWNPSDAVYIQKEVMRENYAHFGDWDDAMRAYNGGWNRSRWGNPETAGYVPSIKRRRERWGNGTPLPEDGGDAGDQKRFIFDAAPIEIIHKNERGEPVQPRQMVSTRIRPAAPFGTERFS